MNHENLKKRTKQFALDVIKFVENMPANRTCNILGGQLLRSGTSAGANYRAACRAKSTADFISKMGTVEGEADASALIKESGELTAIAVSSINTARKSGGR